MFLNEIILNLNCKLIFRLINVIFNGLIIRSINLNLIGIANIRLELIYSTILFFSRESLRHNIPKLSNSYSIYHYINLIWLILPTGFIFISFFLFLTLFFQSNNGENLVPYYNQACFMYALAALIELFSEPFYLLATITQNYYINIYIEFIASIIGFGLQTILIIRNPNSSLFYYGFGYLIYSCLITMIYYLYFLIHKKEERHHLFLITSFKDLLMKPTSPFVDHRLVNNTIKFFKQGISMKILIDGEKYLMSIFYLISYEEQAIFHLIYLLGSIFPRFIFSTIEQIALNYFQQIFSRIKINGNFIQNDQFIHDDQMLLKRCRDDQIFNTNYHKPSTPNEERTIKLNALTLLNNLVRLFVIISLLLSTFLIPYSSKLINVYIGSKFLINNSLIFYLRLYLLNIFLNGINGINELFVQSIMSTKELNNYQNFFLLYSFLYFFFLNIFIKFFNITGIIIMNCLNLILRLILNNYLINRYFNRIEYLKSYLFSSHYIFLLLISFLIYYLNQNLIENHFGQICFAIGFSLTIICLTFIEEKEMIHYIYCVFKLNYLYQRSTLLEKH